MPINIRGKEYFTVAERINTIHAERKDAYEVITDIHTFNPPLVIVRAVIRIHTEGGVREYNGHAYEMMDQGQINSTSALENCETSAIGRALAAAGYGGTEYASANEVENAIHQQSAPAAQTAAAPTGNKPNRYKGVCGKCEQDVAAEAGYTQKVGDKWVTFHTECPAGGPPMTPPPISTKAPQAYGATKGTTVTQGSEMFPCSAKQYAFLLSCLTRNGLTDTLREQAAFLIDNPTVRPQDDEIADYITAGWHESSNKVPNKLEANNLIDAVKKHLAAPPVVVPEPEGAGDELPF